MKKATAVIAAIILAGCVASVPRQPSKPPVLNTVSPRCTGKVQCESMWIDAQSAIEVSSGMRVRMVTDGRITTFAPTTFGKLGGEVIKRPIDENTYEIRASFECYGHTECSDLRILSTNLFNTMVRPPLR